jgi:hypothetical protein
VRRWPYVTCDRAAARQSSAALHGAAGGDGGVDPRRGDLVRAQAVVRQVRRPEKRRLDERHVAFWAAAPPGARNELVAEDPQRFFVPRFGGYDWVGLRLDVPANGPDWQEVAEILTDAYRQVAPKFLIARLD